MVFIELLTLVVAVAILAKSSSVAVDSAAKIAQFFGINQTSVGLILISIVTTFPELTVSIISSSAGQGAIAAGNAFGSVIANILLILGLAAFLFQIKVSRTELKEIGAVLFVTTLVSLYMIANILLKNDGLGFLEGVILVSIFVIYLFYVIRKRKNILPSENERKTTIKEAAKEFILFIVAAVIVIVSAGICVDSAVKIADIFGVAKSFIGSTIIAIGTSLPELSISLQAIRKKDYGIALGDIIGANMANMTSIIGIAAIINPVEVRLPIFGTTLLFAVVANMAFLYCGAINKKIGKKAGLVFLTLYVVYLIAIFILQYKQVAPG